MSKTNITYELNLIFRGLMYYQITKKHVDCCNPQQYEVLLSRIIKNGLKCTKLTKSYLEMRIKELDEQRELTVQRRREEYEKHQEELRKSMIDSEQGDMVQFQKCISCNNDKCHITIRQKQCCTCKDTRPVSSTGYYKYVDGVGDTYEGCRSADYCPNCKTNN